MKNIETTDQIWMSFPDIGLSKWKFECISIEMYFSVLTRDDFDSERIILESENQPIAAICLDLTIKATLEEILNDIQ